MKIQKNFLYGLGTLVLIVIGISFIFIEGGTSTLLVIENNQDIQVVKLYVQNNQYVLEPSSVKKDIPVRLEADISKMPGCSKSIRISSFGVSKIFSSNDNSITFTPNKAGTFNIACSMNMYKGTFTVLESDGTKSNYVEQKLSASAGGSCGTGGGCGCGS